MKWFLALLLALLASAASAQRIIPQDAQRGVLRMVADPVVEINGRQHLLAPGVLIRNELNMIMMPGSLPPISLQVMYRLDPDDTVRHVWILTPEELSAPRDPRLAPAQTSAPMEQILTSPETPTSQETSTRERR